MGQLRTGSNGQGRLVVGLPAQWKAGETRGGLPARWKAGETRGWAPCAVEGNARMRKGLLVMLGGCHMQWEAGESK